MKAHSRKGNTSINYTFTVENIIFKE